MMSVVNAVSSTLVSTDQDLSVADDHSRPGEAPSSVVTAVVAGSVIVPFLIVLSVLFVSHGLFVNIDQPDVTSSRGGEAVVGGIVAAFLAIVVMGLAWLLSGRDRWLFAVGQFAGLAVSIDFVADKSRGEPYVPAVVLAASAIALISAFVPTSWAWVKTYRDR